MIGIISIFNCDAYALMDLGATQSFVSMRFAKVSGVEPESLDCSMVVSTPMEGSLQIKNVFRGSIVVIEGEEFPTNLIVLDIHDFDVILRMDWLSMHHAWVDCFKKEVRFPKVGELDVIFRGI